MPFVAAARRSWRRRRGEHRRRSRVWSTTRSRSRRPARRPDVPRLPAGLRLPGGAASRSDRPRVGRRGRRRRDGRASSARARCCRRRRAAGDHGRHGPLLGPRRGGAAELAQTLRIPVFLNGLARGCVAAGPRAVLLARALARSEGRGRGARGGRADGLPPGLRGGLRRGHADRRDRRGRARAARTRGRSRRSCTAHRRRRSRTSARRREVRRWQARRGSPSCAPQRRRQREGERAEMQDGRSPLHPMRLYAELGAMLDRDAIVIGDGGDFVSYAGRRDRQLSSRAAGSTLGRSAAWARGRATRWRRSSPTPSARWCCCWATARSASRGWSSTRWRGTA